MNDNADTANKKVPQRTISHNNPPKSKICIIL